MKKLLLFLMLALSLGIPRAQADTVKLTLSQSTKFASGKNPSTLTQNGVKWTATTTAGEINGSWNSTNYFGEQFGSSSGGWTGSITTNDITGTITKVVVKCNTGGTTTVGVNVGGNQFGESPQTVIKKTTCTNEASVPSYTFTGSATGDISVNFNTSDKKACYVTSIEVTYEAGPKVPGAPKFFIEGAAVSGSYDAKWNETVKVEVKSENAESLTFTSPAGIGTVAGNIYTLTEIKSNTTITVYGTNEVGTSEEKTFNVNFEPEPTSVDAPVFNFGGTVVSNEVEVKAGSEITITTPTANSELSITATPKDAAVINGTSVTINAACTLTATATIANMTATSTLKVNIKEEAPAPAGAFKLLTDLSILKDGMEVILAYDTNAVATTVSSKKYDASKIDLNDDKTIIISYPENTGIFTLEKSGENWYFVNQENKYLTGSSSTDVSYENSKGNNSTVNLSAATDKEAYTYNLVFGTNTSRALIWRSSNVFGNYAYSNASKNSDGEYHCIKIYYRDSAVEAPVFEVAENATFEIGSDGKKYYTNPFDVTLTSGTEGATIHYSIDGGDELSGDSPVTITVSNSQSIVAYATKDGMAESETVAKSYALRTARPAIVCNDPEEAESKTVTISSATNGAYVQYSLDNGATWSDPVQDAIVLTFNEMGKTVNILARAYSDFDAEGEYSETVENQVSIYPAMKWQPFELLTDVTMLVPGDEIIFVSAKYDKALAPYVTGDRNCKSADIVKTEAEGTPTVRLDPASEAVGIYKVERTDDGMYRFKGTFHGGYLAAVAGNDNLLHCHTDAEMTENDASEATVIVDPTTGEATITFVGEGVTHNTMRFYNGNGSLFSCYDLSEGNTSTTEVSIYRRGAAAEYAPRPVAMPQEGVYDEGEISEVTLQCLDADGNAITDPSLSIYYTLDGSDPRMGGKLYTDPIPVSDNMTVRAYATMDGRFDSPSLIASYDIFRPGKEYRRVTPAEMRQLKANDDIIILGSPSNEETVYALSRMQKGNDKDSYREAVRLDNVVKSDGRIVINKKDVQVLSLIPALDYYTNGGYDWRLYASGSSVGSDYNLDGYLLARDNNNALETERIDTPASELLPDTDVRFLSQATDGQGNEYGGITVQFGSASGNEDTYPKLMALTRSGDGYRFDVRSDADFKGAAASSWYVSVFKIFDKNHLYAPSFSNLDLRITEETPIEITSPNSDNNPETEIWYSINGGADWILYNGPFTVSGEGEFTLLARARNAALEGGDSEGYSETVSQTYVITYDEVFELVTDASTLKENDRIVFVNAVEFTAGVENGDKETLDKKYGADAAWYSLSTLVQSKFMTDKVGAIDNNAIPMMVTVPSESNIQVFRLEYDTSASNPERPWLLNAGDVNNEGKDSYLRSAGEKNFGFTDLPDDIEERQYMNAGIDISTRADYGSYRTTNYTSYNTPSVKTGVEYNAFVTFNGPNGTTNYLRFNPSGTDIHFQAYKENKDSKESPTPSTWPVRIYRATKRVLPPTVTVYDAVAEDKAYGSEIDTFNNAVRVVIRQNPRTDDDSAELLYSWSKTVENAPVLSEYLNAVPADAEEIELYVDGNKIQMKVNGHFTDIDELPSIEGAHVLRAVAATDLNASESLPRVINFQCTKPVLSKADEDNAVKVTRPATYTVNATLYYAYDDDEIVTDEAHRIKYVAGTTDYETIAFDGHDKVKVIAVKAGYENSEVAVYTPYTFTPRAHAIQLLELTAEGKAKFKALLADDDKAFIDDDKPCYVTYRTVETGQFYLLKETGLGVDGEFELAACTNNEAARELIDYRPANAQMDKVNVKFTTDYYVHVLDESDFFATVGEDAEVKEAKIYVNNSTNGRPAQAATFKLNGEDKVYHGMLLKRYGAIGTIVLKSEIEYDVNGETYVENGYDQITPLIPSVYGGHYAYVYSQEEQDLSEAYPTDFLKFNIESRVKKNDDGSWATSEVLIPTADLNPRHFNAVITFFRPNVSDEILRRNDIYYTVDIKGSKNDVKGSGLYVDRAQADLELGENDEVPEFYQFTVADVSPRSAYYPTLKVLATEYVENYNAVDNYGRFKSNYGDSLKVEAQNDPRLGQGTVEKIHLGKLGKGDADPFGHRYTGNDHAWMYKGHYHLDHPGDVAHDNADNTEEAVALAPVYYHVETYNNRTAQYASYEYLVKHVAGHASSEYPLEFGPKGEFITDDDDDPLLGTYVATEIAQDGITVALTPVYIFSRNPEANPDGEDESIIAQLDKVQSLDKTPAPAAAPRKANAPRKAAAGETTLLGGTVAAPAVGEVRPMREYGHTDMQADNITDLTGADAPFDVVPGNVMERALTDDEVTGVENVSLDTVDADAEYYNLQGIRILNPGHGVYIKRRGATSEKVVL